MCGNRDSHLAATRGETAKSTHIAAMNGFRFSLARLMAMVALASVFCAALQASTSFWAGAVFILTIGVLLVGVLAAIYCDGRTRAFWIGFEIVACSYLLLNFAPWFAGNLVLSQPLINQLAQQVGRFSSADPVVLGNTYYSPFAVIVHLSAALALGSVGGLIAGRMHRSTKARSEDAP